jgi:rubredoxin
MKCLCGYEGDDFTWLSLLEVCIPDYTATEEMTTAAIETGLPKGELKRSFACPKCGTVKVEVSK